LSYPDLEVIVVNDGSKDETLDILIREFRLYLSARAVPQTLATKPIRGVYESRDPIRLLVLDKVNGGKADSINTGLNAATSKLVMVCDSDTVIERDGLMQMVKPYMENPDGVIAVGGSVRAVNDCDVEYGRVTKIRMPSSMIADFQAVEYLRAFL